MQEGRQSKSGEHCNGGQETDAYGNQIRRWQRRRREQSLQGMQQPLLRQEANGGTQHRRSDRYREELQDVDAQCEGAGGAQCLEQSDGIQMSMYVASRRHCHSDR